jgi:S-adenosylhomocysteine hydrolase
LTKEFENSEDNEEVDTGVKKFIEMFESGKLELEYIQSNQSMQNYYLRNYDDCAGFWKT